VILLALDPGGTTGWSEWLYTDDAPVTLREWGQIPNGVHGFLSWWRSRPEADLVVSETFRLDGRTLKPDTTPLLVEGALHALFPSWHGQPNTMKVHAPDAFLKAHGFWLVGQPHARDSVRHALAYAKLHKHAPSLRAYWGPR
jgi:hypothetical protein